MPQAPTKTFHLDGSTLNTVPAALALATGVVSSIQGGEHVRLDLQQIERLTPSVANALAMTVLDAIGQADFRSKIDVVFGSTLVEESWNKAVSRYERGIRLTTQRQGAA